MTSIPFNRPWIVGSEFDYIRQAIDGLHLSGDGPFTVKCNSWLEREVGCRRALLTHSCTAALEMAALLLDIRPGDEIVLPSYTFVTTANAFVLRGGVPVFVDVRADTMCIDENKIEEAITPRTKAIVAVHYAGVACEMDVISEIAQKHSLPVIEDAAQALMCSYKGRPLGSFGVAATISFHETKNVICGEGGALLINDPSWIERAEIIREKGTNRSQFFRREVGRYTWVDVGSSFLPSEIAAAFLWAQLQAAGDITSRRLRIWQQYHCAFSDIEQRGFVRRPTVPSACRHNGQIYYLILAGREERDELIESLGAQGISAVFHYVPLHSSPAGIRFGRTHGNLRVTETAGDCLVRLPVWAGMEGDDVARVAEAVCNAVEERASG